MKESLKQRFGKNMAFYRANAKLTQEELAERCDVSVETISHIERGIHGPRFDLLETLAVVLQVEVKQLFEFS